MYNKDFYNFLRFVSCMHRFVSITIIKTNKGAPKFIPRSSLKLLEDSETLGMLLAAPDASEISPNSKQDWREKS